MYLPLVFVCVIVLCEMYPIFNPYIKKYFTIKGLEKDIKSMEIIVKKWSEFDYSYIYIDEEMYNENVITVGYRNHDDSITLDTDKSAYEYLLIDRKYEYITKSDSSICFIRYAFFGNGYGVAFSADGKEPRNESIVSWEKIDGFDKWYFCVID